MKCFLCLTTIESDYKICKKCINIIEENYRHKAQLVLPLPIMDTFKNKYWNSKIGTMFDNKMEGSSGLDTYYERRISSYSELTNCNDRDVGSGNILFTKLEVEQYKKNLTHKYFKQIYINQLDQVNEK